MPLDAKVATAAQCREQAESWQRYAAKAAEKEHAQQVAEAEARLRLADEKHVQNRRRLEALTVPPPEPEATPLETKTLLDWAGELKGFDERGRTLTVLAAGFGDRDDGGDVLTADSLDEFLNSPDADGLPVYYMHRRHGPEAEPPIGLVEQFTKTAAGLLARIRLFESERANAILAAARGLLPAARRTNGKAALGVSIGYTTQQADYGKHQGLPTRFLRRVRLKEISICNPEIGRASCRERV